MEGLSNATGPIHRMNGATLEQLIERRQLQGMSDGSCKSKQSPSDVRLTPRQIECLRWAGEGKSSVDIASILDISPATVDGHVADACSRFGVRTRIQAIVEAYRRGWLE